MFAVLAVKHSCPSQQDIAPPQPARRFHEAAQRCYPWITAEFGRPCPGTPAVAERKTAETGRFAPASTWHKRGTSPAKKAQKLRFCEIND